MSETVVGPASFHKPDHKKFLAILLLALLARLYGITSPLTDGGQERQTQVAMIARNLWRDGYTFLYPRLDVFAPNPGYIGLEFPLQSLLMALLYNLFDEQAVVGRALVLLFSLGSIFFMYRLSSFFVSSSLALFSTAIYALTPLSIYFGHAVFPEALLMFFSLASLFYLMEWSASGRVACLIISMAAHALACLVKAPPGLVISLPLAAIFFEKYGWSSLRRPGFLCYFTFSLLPITGWAIWSGKLGPADPGWNAYQLSALARWGVPSAWFSSYFYWQVLKSIVVVTVTPPIFLLGLMGLYGIHRHRRRGILWSWCAGMLAYVYLTAGVQASHWNYQVPLLPIGALLAACAFETSPALTDGFRQFIGDLRRRMALPVVASLTILCGYVVLYGAVAVQAYDTTYRLPWAIEVGHLTQRWIPREGFVLLVQPGMVPVPQSYFMDRRVRSIIADSRSGQGPLNIDELRRLGAKGLVAVDTPYGSGKQYLQQHSEILRYLELNASVAAAGEGYVIYVFKDAL